MNEHAGLRCPNCGTRIVGYVRDHVIGHAADGTPVVSIAGYAASDFHDEPEESDDDFRLNIWADGVLAFVRADASFRIYDTGDAVVTVSESRPHNRYDWSVARQERREVTIRVEPDGGGRVLVGTFLVTETDAAYVPSGTLLSLRLRGRFDE